MDKPTTPNNSNRRYKGSETRLIYQALRRAKQPLSRRAISIGSGKEIPTLCRALWNLVHRNRTLEVAHYAPCKITGKRVMHYYFRKAKEVRND